MSVAVWSLVVAAAAGGLAMGWRERVAGRSRLAEDPSPSRWWWAVLFPLDIGLLVVLFLRAEEPLSSRLFILEASTGWDVLVATLILLPLAGFLWKPPFAGPRGWLAWLAGLFFPVFLILFDGLDGWSVPGLVVFVALVAALVSDRVFWAVDRFGGAPS